MILLLLCILFPMGLAAEGVAEKARQNSRSKHACTAFIGHLKPYYEKARSMGLDSFSQETAKRLDPDALAKRTVSALFPDSGVLKMAGLLDRPDYEHNNINLGCAQCQGTFVVVTEDRTLKGWPNTGIGRVNPDGSLGSCSSCHTRHRFSVEEARKPHTCGQCHLGPDWSHWNGAVDTIMINLGAMQSDIEMREKLQSLESK